jgi:hypothetical protein
LGTRNVAVALFVVPDTDESLYKTSMIVWQQPSVMFSEA